MLYTMIQIDRATGDERIVYGHASINVINDYLTAYVNTRYDVRVEQYIRSDQERQSSPAEWVREHG